MYVHVDAVAFMITNLSCHQCTDDCRVPLTPELREVLEVAYVSKIMSKNFRKEGQPEKERIAKITGMELEKVW